MEQIRKENPEGKVSVTQIFWQNLHILKAKIRHLERERNQHNFLYPNSIWMRVWCLQAAGLLIAKKNATEIVTQNMKAIQSCWLGLTFVAAWNLTHTLYKHLLIHSTVTSFKRNHYLSWLNYSKSHSLMLACPEWWLKMFSFKTGTSHLGSWNLGSCAKMKLKYNFW